MRLRNRMTKTASDTVKLKQDLISKVNASVDSFSTKGADSYYDEIPLEDIFKTLRKFNLVAIDKDGTDWEGFLTGQSDRVSMEVVLEEEGERKIVENASLTITWYRYDDYIDKEKYVRGKYEVVVYFA